MKKPYKTLGDALKFHREKMGLSRQDVAKLLNVTPSLVAKWEGNLRSCKNRLPELCKYYHVPIEELLMSYKYSKKEMKTQEEKLLILNKRCFVLCIISAYLTLFSMVCMVVSEMFVHDVSNRISGELSDAAILTLKSKYYILLYHYQYFLIIGISVFIISILTETFSIVQRRKLIEENLERLKE